MTLISVNDLFTSNLYLCFNDFLNYYLLPRLGIHIFNDFNQFDFTYLYLFIFPSSIKFYYIFLVAKLLYKSKCPSVCMYVCLSGLGGKAIFSAPNLDIAPIFFVQIPLINEHPFCKYFVRWSDSLATKGRNVKILKTRLIY